MFTHAPEAKGQGWDFLDAANPASRPPSDPLAAARPAAAAAHSGATAGTAADLDYASPYVDDGRLSDLAASTMAVQLSATEAAPPAGEVHTAAQRGMATTSVPLPHADAIQKAFGPDHDLGRIQAHVGGPTGEACNDMGAEAFASGDHVAFEAAPDLHTAAHEAAHVMQQAQGVNLYGGVGQAGDAYEAHADEVADRVVAGESAADLLGAGTGRLAGGGAVQRKETAKAPTAAETRMSAKQVDADHKSGAAMDSGLMMAARQLYGTVPALERGAEEVEIWNDHLKDKKEEIAKAKKQDKSKREREQLEQERWELEGKRSVRIAKERDGAMYHALLKTKGELNAIRHKTKNMGLSGDEIVEGANYLRSVVQKLRGLADRLDLRPYGPLAEVETMLEGVFAELKIVKLPSDPEKLKNVDSLAAESVGHHLDAAAAQAKYARLALDAWTGRGGKAQGQFGELGESLTAIEYHLEDAAKLLQQVDPAERKKFSAKLAAVKMEIQPLHRKGKIRPSGEAPAGSHSMKIDRFPDLLAGVQGALSAKSSGP